jgi:hypothetical protein
MKQFLAMSVSLCVLLVATYCFGAVAISRPPIKQNLGLGDTAGNIPGDPHGAVGRNFVAEHVNNEFQFTNRSTLKVSQYVDGAFGPTSFGGSAFTAIDDGKIYMIHTDRVDAPRVEGGVGSRPRTVWSVRTAPVRCVASCWPGSRRNAPNGHARSRGFEALAF